MFPGRYFAARYFAPRYFPRVGNFRLPITTILAEIGSVTVSSVFGAYSVKGTLGTTVIEDIFTHRRTR